MLVIFEQDEYKIVMQADSHEQAWEKLLKYENLVIQGYNEIVGQKKSFFGDSQSKPFYASVEEVKKDWRFEASTTEGIVEFERGDIVYV